MGKSCPTWIQYDRTVCYVLPVHFADTLRIREKIFQCILINSRSKNVSRKRTKKSSASCVITVVRRKSLKGLSNFVFKENDFREGKGRSLKSAGISAGNTAIAGFLTDIIVRANGFLDRPVFSI